MGLNRAAFAGWIDHDVMDEVQQLADHVADDYREHVGKDTLALEESIHTERVGRRVQIISSVGLTYGEVHEFGGVPHVIRPREKRALAFNGRVYASVHHPGTKPNLAFTHAMERAVL